MPEEPKGDPLRLSQAMPVMIQDLAEGARIRLADGATAEVTSNPRDGMWLFVTYLTSPTDPTAVGAEAMVFANDVLEVIKG